MDNKHPFGLLADKMTAKHRKRHITGVRVPIWDDNNSRINRDIYVTHTAVGYGSGEAIVDHSLFDLRGSNLADRFATRIGSSQTDK